MDAVGSVKNDKMEQDLMEVMREINDMFDPEVLSDLCKKSDNKGNSLVHHAVYNSLIELMNFILSSTGNIDDIFNKEGYNPLHLAVQTNNIVMVRLLSQHKNFNVNTKMENKETALHIATQRGYCKILSELIKNGGDLSQQDEDGHTPLHDGLEQVYFEAETDTEEKCKKFFRVWDTIVDETPLWWSLTYKCEEPENGSEAYLKLQRKAVYYLRSYIKNNDGLSVLQFAADRGLVKCVQIMLVTKDVFVIPIQVTAEKNKYKGGIYEIDITNLCPEYFVPQCILDSDLRLKETSKKDESATTEIQPKQEINHQPDSFLNALADIQPPNIAGKILESVPMTQLTHMEQNVSRVMYSVWMLIHFLLMVFATATVTAYHIDFRPVLVAFLLIYSTIISISHCARKVIMFNNKRHKTIPERLSVKNSIKRYQKPHEKDLIYQFFSTYLEIALVTELSFTAFAWAVYVPEMLDLDLSDHVWIKGFFLLLGWLKLLIPMTSIGVVYKLISVLKDVAIYDILPWLLIFYTISIGFATAINLEFQQLPSNSTCTGDQHDLVGFLQGTIETLLEVMLMTYGLGSDLKDIGSVRCLSRQNGKSGLVPLLLVTSYAMISAVIFLNILIAIMSETVTKAQRDKGWRQYQVGHILKCNFDTYSV